MLHVGDLDAFVNINKWLLSICYMYFQDGVFICSHASYAVAVVTNLNMLIADTKEA